MRAARVLGVAPWDLARVPVSWVSWALTVDAAEREALDAGRKKGVGGDGI